MAHRNQDPQQESPIAVNGNYIPDDTVDCGIRRLGWCRGPSCQKHARLPTFVVILAIAGLLQGACETYFRISAKQTAVANGYNPIVVEWLLVSSGIFQALFAVGFAHWAHKFHHISWLSGVLLLQSATCVIVMIPNIMNFADGVTTPQQVADSNLCQANSLYAMNNSLLTADQSQWLMLVLLFVLQLAIGLASLAFYTIGIVYIDDNSQSLDSAAVIAAAVAAKIVGTQLGSSLTIGIDATGLGWWLGWVILAPMIFVSGLLLGLFPKRLPKTVIHQAAQRIIEDTHNFGSQLATYIDDPNLGPSMKRLFSNKLLQCNLLSLMFIQSAVLNYAAQEETYMQSRFMLPYNEEDGLQQEWKLRFVSYFLRPPVAAIGMLVGGLVISKMKLSGRTIAGISIAMGIHLLAFYIGVIFLKCDVGPIAGVNAGKLQQPFCSRQCICPANVFSPVCPENSTVTYFSPCYAGCYSQSTINNVDLYESCSCGSDFEMHTPANVRATEGACSAETCATMLIVFQVMSLFAAGVLGVMLIGKIIITLRCVLPQDKPLALAMELMYVGLFAYVPVHLAYDVVTRTTCLYWAPEYAKCVLHETPKHGNILNILSAALILVGIVFDILVFVFAKGLNIYNCKVTDVNYTPSLYSALPREDSDQLALHNAAGGSPTTTMTSTSPVQPHQRRTMPNNEITVFRQPSSVTSSAPTESSFEPSGDTGVTYAQVVFPPDKHKSEDGTTSPKRMAVRADVPQHHLSSHDVRAQLGNLKSFTPKGKAEEPSGSTAQPQTTAASIAPVAETNLDDIRPTSPETDF